MARDMTELSGWKIRKPSVDLLSSLELAEKLKSLARDLSRPPTQQSIIRMPSERMPRPVYWRGRQWAVTGYGIQARNGRYFISKRRIWEREDTYGWLQEMADDNWVDLPDFSEALRVARMRWRKGWIGLETEYQGTVKRRSRSKMAS